MFRSEKGHKIEIQTGAYPSGGTKVLIDEVEVKELIDVRFKHCVGAPLELMLRVYPSELRVTGQILEDSLKICNELVDVICDKDMEDSK